MWDLREAFSQGDALRLAAQELWAQIEPHNPDFIIGRGLGALPLLVAIHLESLDSPNSVYWSFVRDERKDRNRCKLIEGTPVWEGARVFVVDDLLTTGDNLNKTLLAYSEEGITLDIIGVAVVIDQWRGRGSRALEAQGKRLISLFRRHDFGLTRIDTPYEGHKLPLKWWNMGVNSKRNGHMRSTPTVAGSRIFIGTDRTSLQCLDWDTGNRIWERHSLRPAAKSIAGAPQVFANKVLWAAYDGSVTCCQQETGELVWARRVDSWVHSTPQIDEMRRRVYLGTEWYTGQGRGDILALDLDTGKELWRYPTDNYVPCTPFHQVERGRLLIGSNDENLYCLFPDDGFLIGKVPINGPAKGQPVAKDNSVFVATEKGYLHCIDLRNGEELWGVKVANNLRHVRPLLYENLVIVPNSDGLILALDQETGKTEWLVQLRQAVNYSLTPYLWRWAFAIQVDGYLALIDLIDGKKVWVQKQLVPNIRVTQPVKIYGSTMFVTSDRGLLTYELEFLRILGRNHD